MNNLKNAPFEKRLLFGRDGENKILKWLLSRGNTVLPIYDSGGKAPKLISSQGNLVAPDYLTLNPEAVAWVEAKHKGVFSWYRIGQCWVTGIDVRYYLDYLKILDNFPIPVWLLFLHEREEPNECDRPYLPAEAKCPTGLFGNSIRYLREHENHRSDKHGREGMVYWNLDHLQLLAGVEQL